MSAPLTPERESEYRALIARTTDLGAVVASPGVLQELLSELDRVRAELAARPSRAEVLREASEVAVSAARACGDSETGQYAASVAAGIGKELRRIADEAASS